MVARQTLTLFVRVRILLRLPPKKTEYFCTRFFLFVDGSRRIRKAGTWQSPGGALQPAWLFRRKANPSFRLPFRGTILPRRHPQTGESFSGCHFCGTVLPRRRPQTGESFSGRCSAMSQQKSLHRLPAVPLPLGKGGWKKRILLRPHELAFPNFYNIKTSQNS